MRKRSAIFVLCEQPAGASHVRRCPNCGASSVESFARIFALDFARVAASMRRVPYSYLPPDELRKRIARTLYAEAQRERPDWIDEQLLRPGQVAALFQVSRRTVADWARAGKLDAIITPGGHRRFRATQVRALLESRLVPATIPATA